MSQLPTALTAAPSFGGLTLTENLRRAEVAIAKCEPLERIFNRSQSQWMRRHLTFSWYSAAHNIRQLAAEVSRKREALSEARHGLLLKQAEAERKQAEIELLREEALEVTSPARRRLLEADIAVKEVEAGKLDAECGNSLKYVEGALKDVLAMEKLHDELVAQHGLISEADFEAAEQRSQLVRAFSQALRDIRSTGRISNGNQEYLEQCGVNPTAALRECLEYLKLEQAGGDDVTPLAEFLNRVAERFEPCGAVACAARGFTETTREDALYALEDAA